MPNPLELAMQPTDPANSLWCWAAVAASIGNFLDRNNLHTQCKIAKTVIGPHCCAGGDCNHARDLRESLEAANGHFSFHAPGHVLFGTIRGQIDDGLPLGVRIGWPDQSVGHFIAIIGYHTDTEKLVVVDPQFENYPAVDIATLTSSYRGLGRWTDTYFTA